MVKVKKKQGILKVTTKTVLQQEVDYISTLPMEILEKIFICLDVKSLCQCKLVSKNWQDIILQDYLWQKICEKEFDIVARKAKENASSSVTWYQIYRNLKMWPHITKTHNYFRKVFELPANTSDVTTADLNQGILVLNGSGFTKLLDVNKQSPKPIIINGKQIVEKIASNKKVTVLQVKIKESNNDLVESALYIQRSPQLVNSNTGYIFEEAQFSGVNIFCLTEDELYYSDKNNVIYKVDLNVNKMEEQFFCKSAYLVNDIIVHYRNANKDIDVILFTKCLKLVTYRNNNFVDVKPAFTLTSYYHKETNKIFALDENTFIYYSHRERKLGISKTSQRSEHYEFPPCTDVIFYNNLVIFATSENKIQLYDSIKHYLSEDDDEDMLYDTIATLPKKYTDQVRKISISEGSTGPIIMVATLKRVYLCKWLLFPLDKATSMPFENQFLYERLIALRDRLEKKSKLENILPERKSRKRKLDS